MATGKPANTTYEQKHGLHSESGELLHDQRSHQSLLERLIYLSNTLLDISYAVSVVSQGAPCTKHMTAIYKILKIFERRAKMVFYIHVMDT